MRISDWRSDVCSSDLNPDAWDWPLIVKARGGSASRGLRLVNGPSDLPDLTTSEPLVAQQRLTGPEYTVNVYFNGDGRMRTSVPHERIRVRAGEVEKGVTRRLPQLQDLAERIAAALPGPDRKSTSELQSLMRISYAVFCLKKKTNKHRE